MTVLRSEFIGQLGKLLVLSETSETLYMMNKSIMQPIEFCFMLIFDPCLFSKRCLLLREYGTRKTKVLKTDRCVFFVTTVRGFEPRRTEI